MSPTAARISDLRIDTSVRKGEITFNAGLDGLAADASYTLHARIADAWRKVAEFTSPPLRTAI